MGRTVIAVMLLVFVNLFVVPAAEPLVLKVTYSPGNMPAEDSPEIMFGEVFKKEVEARSNGRIAVEIYPSGQLGVASEMLQGVMAGYIEMTLIDNTMLNQHFRLSQLLAAPGIFSTISEWDEVMAGPWGEMYREEVRKNTGVMILNMYCKGFRHFTTSNKELRVVGDARGVTFRVMESPVAIRMVEALGARAVPMPGSEMYMAMRTGVVDGQENPIASFIQDKSFEVQKYMVLNGHVAGVTLNTINAALFDSLSPDLRQAIQEAADIAAEEGKRVMRDLEVRGVQYIRDQGLTVYQPTPEELKDWHDAIRGPTQEYIRSVLGEAPMEELLKAIEVVRNK
ncbi:MAG: TRAP transporter substrate-binding protein [Planctomycetes bacterium]|nr:TRAP transporter substrate-binding protein [Planctomycetota bacterium]